MPHASGDEPWDNWYYFIDDVVNPTQVGMNRVSSSSATPPENVPHASGDACMPHASGDEPSSITMSASLS